MLWERYFIYSIVDVVVNYIIKVGLYFLKTQRCWFKYIFQVLKNGRRDSDPTLLYRKRTERRKVYVLLDRSGLYILYAHRCC